MRAGSRERTIFATSAKRLPSWIRSGRWLGQRTITRSISVGVMQPSPFRPVRSKACRRTTSSWPPRSINSRRRGPDRMRAARWALPGASFSYQARSRNAGLYEAIRTMPFNADLGAGVLSEARFRHYITQDAHYLIGFGRALALAAAKAPNPDRIVQFAKAAVVAIVVERALHGSFFAQFAITPEMFAQTPLSPT